MAGQGALQAALGAGVEVLHAGSGVAQLGLLEASRGASVLAREVLGVDEEGESLVERQTRGARVVALRLPGFGYAEQVHFIEFFEGGLGQHLVLLHR